MEDLCSNKFLHHIVWKPVFLKSLSQFIWGMTILSQWADMRGVGQITELSELSTKLVCRMQWQPFCCREGHLPHAGALAHFSPDNMVLLMFWLSAAVCCNFNETMHMWPSSFLNFKDLKVFDHGMVVAGWFMHADCALKKVECWIFCGWHKHNAAAVISSLLFPLLLEGLLSHTLCVQEAVAQTMKEEKWKACVALNPHNEQESVLHVKNKFTLMDREILDLFHFFSCHHIITCDEDEDFLLLAFSGWWWDRKLQQELQVVLLPFRCLLSSCCSALHPLKCWLAKLVQQIACIHVCCWWKTAVTVKILKCQTDKSHCKTMLTVWHQLSWLKMTQRVFNKQWSLHKNVEWHIILECCWNVCAKGRTKFC